MKNIFFTLLFLLIISGSYAQYGTVEIETLLPNELIKKINIALKADKKAIGISDNYEVYSLDFNSFTFDENNNTCKVLIRWNINSGLILGIKSTTRNKATAEDVYLELLTLENIIDKGSCDILMQSIQNSFIKKIGVSGNKTNITLLENDLNAMTSFLSHPLPIVLDDFLSYSELCEKECYSDQEFTKKILVTKSYIDTSDIIIDETRESETVVYEGENTLHSLHLINQWNIEKTYLPDSTFNFENRLKDYITNEPYYYIRETGQKIGLKMDNGNEFWFESFDFYNGLSHFLNQKEIFIFQTYLNNLLLSKIDYHADSFFDPRLDCK